LALKFERRAVRRRRNLQEVGRLRGARLLGAKLKIDNRGCVRVPGGQIKLKGGKEDSAREIKWGDTGRAEVLALKNRVEKNKIRGEVRGKLGVGWDWGKGNKKRWKKNYLGEVTGKKVWGGYAGTTLRRRKRNGKNFENLVFCQPLKGWERGENVDDENRTGLERTFY